MFKTREEKKQLAVNKADECKKNSKKLDMILNAWFMATLNVNKKEA